MPYKSKRNRRDIPRSKRIAASSTAASGTANAQSNLSQPNKVTTAYGTASKTAAAVTVSPTHFLSEIKWIGITSAIIVILLVVSYYLFK